MDPYLVVGEFHGKAWNMKPFETFELALDFVHKTDSLGRCWIKCPDGRWYHPDTDTWR